MPRVVCEYVLVNDVAVDPHGDRLGGGHGRHPADIERNARVLGRHVEDRVFVGPVDASARLIRCDILICEQSDLTLSALRSAIVRRPEYRPVVAPGVQVVGPSGDSEHVEDVEERNRSDV